MSLLYNDEKMLTLERNGQYRDVIEYLKSISKSAKTQNVLLTIITSSWYYAFHAEKSGENFDLNYYTQQWRKYISIGLHKYFNDPEFCFFAGYTLKLHGFYIMKSFADMGNDLIDKASLSDKNEKIKAMSLYIKNKCRHTKQTDGVDFAALSKELFPSESLIDNYFGEIFS